MGEIRAYVFKYKGKEKLKPRESLGREWRSKNDAQRILIIESSGDRVGIGSASYRSAVSEGGSSDDSCSPLPLTLHTLKFSAPSANKYGE